MSILLFNHIVFFLFLIILILDASKGSALSGLLNHDMKSSFEEVALQTQLAASKKSLVSHVHGRKRTVPSNVGSRPQAPIRTVSSAFRERSAIPHLPEFISSVHSTSRSTSNGNKPRPWRSGDLTKCNSNGCWSIDTTDVETQRTLHALK